MEPGHSYNVISTRKGLILVDTRNGNILNPLGIDRTLSTDMAVKHGDFYRKLSDVEREIREKRSSYFDSIKAEIEKEEALDKEVQRILAEDEEHQRFLRLCEELDTLEPRFTAHHNNILHAFWETHNLGALDVNEPPKGAYNAEAHNRYLELIDEITGAPRRAPPSRDARERVDETREKLNNMHQDWMREHSRPPADMEGWKPK